jgi:hypothetical protein
MALILEGLDKKQQQHDSTAAMIMQRNVNKN